MFGHVLLVMDETMFCSERLLKNPELRSDTYELGYMTIQFRPMPTAFFFITNH